jgi:Uma2 family endonuclease
MSAVPVFDPDLVMTEAEYLAFEDAAKTKHEFVDGHVYDWPGYDYDVQGQAGATRTHNQLQVNVLAGLASAALAAGCQAYGSDMRLRVRGPRTRRYYYPDAAVLRDHDLGEGDDEMHITRPCVLVEILSRGSTRIDHTEKLQVYQSLPSVRAYLIVHQGQQRIERHWRADGDEAWQAEVITSGSVPIPCIGLELTLDVIYAGVTP